MNNKVRKLFTIFALSLIIILAKTTVLASEVQKLAAAKLSSNDIKIPISGNTIYIPKINLDNTTPSSAISNFNLDIYWYHNYTNINREYILENNPKFEQGEYSLYVYIEVVDPSKNIVDYENFPENISLNGFEFSKNSCCDYYIMYSYTFNVEPKSGTKPTINSEFLASGKKGIEYNFQLEAWGSDAIKFELEKNNKLPKGLTLSSDGIISGIPTESGKFTFNIIASNKYGKTTKKFTLTIEDIFLIKSAQFSSNNLKLPKIGESLYAPIINIDTINSNKSINYCHIYPSWSYNGNSIPTETINNNMKFKLGTYTLFILFEVENSEKALIDNTAFPETISINGIKFTQNSSCPSYIYYYANFTFFDTKKLDISKINKVVYTGKNIMPSLTVKYNNIELIKDIDYKLSYTNNLNIGTATITVEGIGNYIGTQKINFKIIPKQVQKIKITNLKNKEVTLKWQKNAGKISGYKIYQYNSTSKKYQYLGKTSKTRYTIKKLSPGKNYKFKIVAYKTIGKNNYESQKSIIKTSTKPSTPKFKNITSGTSKVQFNWKKIPGASGYEIYMSTNKNINYKKIKTLTKNNSTKYSKNNLNTNKTYYFKIRAYKNVNGSKLYSSYSKVQQITLK